MKRTIFYLLILITFCIESTIVTGQAWQPLGQGLSNMVNALAFDSTANILYASGQFTNSAGKPLRYIAAWNGNEWTSLGTGMDNPVRSLAIINDTLYAGGEFTLAGGTNAKCIAKWDGTQWHAMGEGMIKTGQHTNIPSVNAIIEYKGEIYAGGSFDHADGNLSYFIARWNGKSWQTVGNGLSGSSPVYAFAVYNNELYAAGGFTVAGGNSVDQIARWNGTEWKPAGNGLKGTGAAGIYALQVYKNELYATGGFTATGSKKVNYIAKWNGTEWNEVGTGLDNAGLSLTVFNDELYAGGFFRNAGNKPADYIAKWNGTEWNRAIENSTNGRINTLLGIKSRNSLLAGGLFTDVGALRVNNIAELVALSGINGNDPTLLMGGDFSIYPNPVTSQFTVKIYNRISFSPGSYISLKNILGVEIRKIKLDDRKEIAIERNDLPAGIYFATIIDNNINRSLTAKIVFE